MEAIEGGKIAYLKNEEYQGYDANGNPTYKGWKMVAGSESDWNAKFEWPMDGTPTLTLKNAKMDMIGDDGNMLYIPDGEGGYKSQNSVSAIISVTNYQIDLKVVLEGENWIDVNNGIIRGATADSNYFKNITITGTGKLSGTGRGIGISAKTGYTLTIDGPTLDLATTTVGGGTPIPIRTSKGNLTIKNATVTVGNEKSMAIYAETSGDIIIENSTINVYSQLTGTSGSAAINAGGGSVIITNSTINAEGVNNPGISAKTKIQINSGNVSVKSGYYCIYSKEGEVVINGGTVLCDATNGSGAFYKAPTLGAGVDGLAGVNEDNADFYDETKYMSKWVKLTAGNAPVNPGNPGGETTAPSNPSGTTSTNPGGNNPATGDTDATMFVVMLLIGMFGIVAVVSFGKKRAV